MTKAPRPQKYPQNAVEKAVAQLSPENLEEFNTLVRANSSHRAIAEWFEGLGIKISADQVATWWKRHRPRGKELITLNAWAEQFRGADEDELLELSAGLTANLVKILYADYEADNVSGNVKLQSLLEAIRELRQITDSIRNRRTERNEQEAMFAGAIALKEHLEKTFRQTSFSEPLALAVESYLSEKFS
jgi:hypothetical protein